MAQGAHASAGLSGSSVSRDTCWRQGSRSVNHGVDLILPFEMGDFEVLDGLQRPLQRDFGRAALAGLELLAHLPERSQHPSPVEPLTLTMFAEAHANNCIADVRRGAGRYLGLYSATSDP